MIHDIRFFNFALLDILATVILILVIHKYKLIRVPLSLLVLMFFILTVFVHYIFGINTTLNYKLGLSDKPTRYRGDFKIFDIVSSK